MSDLDQAVSGIQKTIFECNVDQASWDVIPPETSAELLREAADIAEEYPGLGDPVGLRLEAERYEQQAREEGLEE